MLVTPLDQWPTRPRRIDRPSSGEPAHIADSSPPSRASAATAPLRAESASSRSAR